jgi:hypothetical protein
MQAGSAAQGVGTIPRRRRLNVLLAAAAVLVVAAMVALLVWAGPLTTSQVGTEDAIPKAGSAVVHDDAGNLNRNSYPLPHGKVAQPFAGASDAVLHDDAGNMPPSAGSAIIHDDAGNFLSR